MIAYVLALFIVRRNPKVDYRVLVAAAYLGPGCTWHSGLTGSATLMMVSPGKAFVKSAIKDGLISAPISTGSTIFYPFNVILVAVVIILP
ncbi:MAG: TIGR00366 family protein [Desulfatiglandaceae bacterium]